VAAGHDGGGRGGALGVYNIGQLTNGKQKAVNAADAAALAGATVEARTLNLMAYNNRSLIANEVFMIQTTALQGYMQYLSHTADNIEDYAKWIPYVGEVLSAILTTVEKVTAAIEKAMDVAIPAQVVVLEGLKKVTAATHGVLATTASLMADKAAADLVAANRAQFGTHMDAGVSVESRAAVKTFTTAQNLLKWKAFTKRYSGSERKDAADVLLASRDKFTGGPRPGSPLLTLNLGLMGFVKDGDTRLVSYDRWETEDTYEYWYWGLCGKPPLPCKKYEAIGWGAATWTSLPAGVRPGPRGGMPRSAPTAKAMPTAAGAACPPCTTWRTRAPRPAKPWGWTT
jgi:hypothetical protein